MHPKLVLLLILLAYLAVGTLYAVQTPDWQVPDEPAHYNYVRQLAEAQRLPVLEAGDYDQDYLARLTREHFPPALPLKEIEYEDHQPPLYYLLVTPIYLAFDGALLPLRLFSVLLGAGVVLLAYAVAASIFPGQPLIPWGTAAFVAFLPQHVAMMAGVNNDSLAELLIGITLWITVRWLRTQDENPTEGTNRWLAGLGVTLGLGLVTKTTVIPVALAVALALLLLWRRKKSASWRWLLRSGTLIFVPALLIAAVWWTRNLSLYGEFDLYGLTNHDAVVVGQPRTVDWIRDRGIVEWLERAITFTFQSFWGQFGWMGVVMPTWLYRALAIWSGALLGGGFYWFWKAHRKRQQVVSSVPLVFLGFTVLLAILAYVYYNRTFVQHQGRYLFPALIPIALGAALATDALLRLVRLPERLREPAYALPYLAMFALCLYALERFILPTLT